MLQINFNADIGEGIGNEAELLPYLQSCNISSGAHAGTKEEIRLAIKLAIEHKVTIGAHPSFEDKENFGRKALNISNEELYGSIRSQLEFLNNVITSQGGKLAYVKPHGALYHEASTNKDIASTIIKASQTIDPSIKVMGMPNTVMETIAKEMNCPFIKEGFADRSYHNNGSLVARSNSKGVLTNTQDVVNQVGDIINQNIKTIEGKRLSLEVDSICFHGDTDNAIELLKACYNKYVI